ncbi:MAG: pentapeptide repeat-containing protein [Elainellaceae cyanobacterium]
MMRIFRVFVGLAIALFAVAVFFPPPSYAASSAAIRAYDDVKADTKDFAGESLVQAEFNNSDLKGADFSHADLRGAVFNGSVLKNANFHAADFSDGIAYISDFSGADLSDAILTSAMLLQTRFRDATITGADFSFALLDRQEVMQLCERASGINPTTGISTRDSLECR